MWANTTAWRVTTELVSVKVWSGINARVERQPWGWGVLRHLLKTGVLLGARACYKALADVEFWM